MTPRIFIFLAFLVVQLKASDFSFIKNPAPSIICVAPSNEYDIVSLIL